MSDLFIRYTKLIHDAEEIMCSSTGEARKEMHGIVEELIYMRFREDQANANTASGS